MVAPNKSLGQHWLHDRFVLEEIAETADITKNDTVLEIGPGLGTLTSELLRRAKEVIAVEFDRELAKKLPGQFPGKKLTVINEDILSFDLGQLAKNYIVVANVPYYITSKIVQKLMTADNRPRIVVLLVQKEVAERIAAGPGDMSLLGISAQIYADATLGDIVPRELFTPAPKVDSQVVVLHLRDEPRVAAENEREFFRVVKAGFSAKRKKLRGSLSGGLGLSKLQIEELLKKSDVSPNSRAEDLSIEDWQRIVGSLRTGGSL